MLKTFRMIANIEFKALDIDDAFKELSDYFDILYNSLHSNLIISGEIVIKPKEDLNDQGRR